MKDSFILHHDTLSVISELTDEQAGQLIKEIHAYSIYINNPEEAKKPNGLNGLMNSVLHPFKMQLERDLEKYLNVVERNKKNGQKGGRPSKEKTQINPSKPKKADKDKEKDNDSDKDKEKETNNNMLENEFQACWKDYTLTFIKSQGRSGGSKKNALANYKKLRKKYQHEDILDLIENHKSLKIGHKDLERLLREDMIKQFLEEGNISTSLVPKDLIGKKYKVDGVVIEFTSKGYNKVEQDWLVTNPQNVKDMIESVRSASWEY